MPQCNHSCSLEELLSNREKQNEVFRDFGELHRLTDGISVGNCKLLCFGKEKSFDSSQVPIVLADWMAILQEKENFFWLCIGCREKHKHGTLHDLFLHFEKEDEKECTWDNKRLRNTYFRYLVEISSDNKLVIVETHFPDRFPEGDDYINPAIDCDVCLKPNCNIKCSTPTCIHQYHLQCARKCQDVKQNRRPLGKNHCFYRYYCDEEYNAWCSQRESDTFVHSGDEMESGNSDYEGTCAPFEEVTDFGESGPSLCEDVQPECVSLNIDETGSQNLDTDMSQSCSDVNRQRFNRQDGDGTSSVLRDHSQQDSKRRFEHEPGSDVEYKAQKTIASVSKTNCANSEDDTLQESGYDASDILGTIKASVTDEFLPLLSPMETFECELSPAFTSTNVANVDIPQNKSKDILEGQKMTHIQKEGSVEVRKNMDKRLDNSERVNAEHVTTSSVLREHNQQGSKRKMECKPGSSVDYTKRKKIKMNPENSQDNILETVNKPTKPLDAKINENLPEIEDKIKDIENKCKVPKVKEVSNEDKNSASRGQHEMIEQTITSNDDDDDDDDDDDSNDDDDDDDDDEEDDESDADDEDDSDADDEGGGGDDDDHDHDHEEEGGGDDDKKEEREEKRNLACYTNMESFDNGHSFKDSDQELQNENSICERDMNDKEKLEINHIKNQSIHTSQLQMGSILVARIEKIMEKYYGKNLQRDFDKFEFIILTARMKLLQTQTAIRVADTALGLLSKDIGEKFKDRLEYAMTNIVWMYARKDVEILVQHLQENVENPRTFVLIIADECHWGITPTTDDKFGANNEAVNTWYNHENVFVLQVSATPYNLLTKNSRIPNVPHPDKSGCLLHFVDWSENVLENIYRDVRVKLQGFHENKLVQLLMVGDHLCIKDTSEAEGMEELLLVQKDNSLRIFTANKARVGTICTDGKLKFVPVEETNGAAAFKVGVERGMGLLTLIHMEENGSEKGENGSSGVTCYLSCDNNIVSVKSIPGNKKPDPSCVFMLCEMKGVRNTQPTLTYVSLNYYHNTMREEERDKQLLREDRSFQELRVQWNDDRENYSTEKKDGKEVKKCQICGNDKQNKTKRNGRCLDEANVQTSENQNARNIAQKCLCDRDLLAAEYAYFIIHHFSGHQNRQGLQNTANLQGDGKDNNAIVDEEFTRYLDTSALKCIPSEVFGYVVNYHTSTKDSKENNTSVSHQETPRFKSTEMDSRNSDSQNRSNNETAKIVSNLISSGNKMKIIRVVSKAQADRFYNTLTEARNYVNARDKFAVLKAYGNADIENQMKTPENKIFVNKLMATKRCQTCDCCRYIKEQRSLRCEKCGHLHLVLRQYQDLEDVPCILILVEKGRMGDTFPKSFDCMDLRLSHSNRPSNLSTAVQELGRMCRYIDPRCTDSLPYALIGVGLYKKLKKGLEKNTQFFETNLVPDDRMRELKTKEICGTSSSFRWSNYEAIKSYDSGNTTKFKNRLLLQAEPQIGKTGTFLCVAMCLKQQIEGINPGYNNEDVIFEDEEGEESDTEDQNEDESGILRESDWIYPYWKTMADSDSLPKEVSSSKYDRFVGRYNYEKDLLKHINPKHVLLHHLRNKVANSSNKKLESDELSTKYLACSPKHHSTCPECLLSVDLRTSQSDKRTIQGLDFLDNCTCDISIPRLERFAGVLEHLENKGLLEVKDKGDYNDRMSVQRRSRRSHKRSHLKYWIFNPSYGRANNALLNYRHTMMVSEFDDTEVMYVQWIVVRPEEFQQYCTYWDKTHAIISLPNTMTDCESDVTTGGVGFARQFIQRLSALLKLDCVFVLDDHIPFIQEVEFESIPAASTDAGGKHNSSASVDGTYTKVVKRRDKKCNLKDVPIAKALLHLQSQIEGKCPPPKSPGDFQPCSKVDADAEGLLPSYTGPASMYALLGVRKMRPGVYGMVTPFKRMHVHAAVLLNIKATTDRGNNPPILYKPWPFWEDVHFNNDCDEAGLYVCKYSRFVMTICQMGPRNVQGKSHSRSLGTSKDTGNTNPYKWTKDTKVSNKTSDWFIKDVHEEFTLMTQMASIDDNICVRKHITIPDVNSHDAGFWNLESGIGEILKKFNEGSRQVSCDVSSSTQDVDDLEYQESQSESMISKPETSHGPARTDIRCEPQPQPSQSRSSVPGLSADTRCKSTLAFLVPNPDLYKSYECFCKLITEKQSCVQDMKQGDETWFLLNLPDTKAKDLDDLIKTVLPTKHQAMDITVWSFADPNNYPISCVLMKIKLKIDTEDHAGNLCKAVNGLKTGMHVSVDTCSLQREEKTYSVLTQDLFLSSDDED